MAPTTVLVLVLGWPTLATAELKLPGGDLRRLSEFPVPDYSYENCTTIDTIEQAQYDRITDLIPPNMLGWEMQPAGFTAKHSRCWKFNYPMCAGKRQSPVHIESKRRLSDDTHSGDAHSSGTHTSSGGDHSTGTHSSPAPTPPSGGDHSGGTHSGGDHSGGTHSTPAPASSGSHSGGSHSGGSHSAPSPAPSSSMVGAPAAPATGGFMQFYKAPAAGGSTPKLVVDKWFKSVRADGDFGQVTIDGMTYNARYLHLLTSSLHKIDDKKTQGEMLIVCTQSSGSRPAPWSPGAEDQKLVILSVLFEQSDTGGSDVWEAMGFPKDRTVLPQVWKNQGFQNWNTMDMNTVATSLLSGEWSGYWGSLPVPPCWENALYYVMHKTATVSHKQVEGLEEVLRANFGTSDEYQPRPLQRKIGAEAHNTAVVKGSTTDSCNSLEVGKQATAICWSTIHKKCDVKSPVNVLSNNAATAAASLGYTTPVYDYVPTLAESKPEETSLVVRAAQHHNFGHVEIGGRFYVAKYIQVHAVGIHAIDGKRYDGEIHIHHETYGAWFEREEARHAGSQHRRMSEMAGHGPSTSSGVHHGPGSDHHHVDGGVHIVGGSAHNALKHEVIVVIPLKITTADGPEIMNELMPHTTEQGKKAYLSHQTIQNILRGEFLHYNGGLIFPACEADVQAQWIVYKEPLEVSAAQLATRYPTFSGFVTSPPFAKHTPPKFYRNMVPRDAMGSGRSCGQLDHNGSWTYEESECWSFHYPNCSGFNGVVEQSPINIVTSEAVDKGSHLHENFLSFAKYHPVDNMWVKNIGHSLKIADAMNGISHLGLGYFEALGNFYFIQQVNLHFPSEHTIDGKQHGAEMHLVHHRQDHWGHAAYDNDDVLVAAIFFDISPTNEENSLLRQLGLPGTPPAHHGDVARVPHPVDLMRALGPILMGDFYRYRGSFTTPPCTQGVKWFVFKTSLSMSLEQWMQFKAIFPNPNTFRPVQPLNNRKVAKNSFTASDENYEAEEYDFWLDRHRGRNRNPPSPWIITGGVVGCLVLTPLIMWATFIRQNPDTLLKSAGGLVASSEPVGRTSRYGRMGGDRL